MLQGAWSAKILHKEKQRLESTDLDMCALRMQYSASDPAVSKSIKDRAKPLKRRITPAGSSDNSHLRLRVSESRKDIHNVFEM